MLVDLDIQYGAVKANYKEIIGNTNKQFGGLVTPPTYPSELCPPTCFWTLAAMPACAWEEKGKAGVSHWPIRHQLFSHNYNYSHISNAVIE
jgi:hypothetical protein